VQEDQVHVRGDVELLAAQLAQPRDDERRARRRNGRGDALLGERGHRGEHLGERREIVEIAMRERDHHAFAQRAKAPRKAFGLARQRLAHLLARERGGVSPLQVLHYRGTCVSYSGNIARQAASSFEAHHPEATIQG
jgi:hypothetical protein